MMLREDYIKEYHAGSAMMSDVLRFYKCNGLDIKDVKYLLEYAGEEDIAVSDILTPRQFRCKDCVRCIQNYDGDWICNFHRHEKDKCDIHTITDEECKMYETTETPNMNAIVTDDVISLTREYEHSGKLDANCENFVCELLGVSNDTLYSIIENNS